MLLKSGTKREKVIENKRPMLVYVSFCCVMVVSVNFDKIYKKRVFEVWNRFCIKARRMISTQGF